MSEPDGGSTPVDPRIHALLTERTAALAARGRSAIRPTSTRSLLVCLSDGDRYGLPLEAVAHVVPGRACTPVPGAPPELLGLAAFSGRVVSVLDLAGALGRPRAPRAGDARAGGHILVLRGGAAPLALAVDRVLSVADVDGGHAEGGRGDGGAATGPLVTDGLGADAVSGYAPGSGQEAAREGGGTGIVVIDLPRLLRRYLPQG